MTKKNRPAGFKPEMGFENFVELLDIGTCIMPPLGALLAINYGLNFACSSFSVITNLREAKNALNAKRNKFKKTAFSTTSAILAGAVTLGQVGGILAFTAVLPLPILFYGLAWASWLAWTWFYVGKSLSDIHKANKKLNMEYLVYDRLLKHHNLSKKINALRLKRTEKNKFVIDKQIAHYENIQERLLTQALAVTKVAYHQGNTFTNKKYNIAKTNPADYIVHAKHLQINEPDPQDFALTNHLLNKQQHKKTNKYLDLAVANTSALALTALFVGLTMLIFTSLPLLSYAIVATGALMTLGTGIFFISQFANKLFSEPKKIYNCLTHEIKNYIEDKTNIDALNKSEINQYTFYNYLTEEEKFCFYLLRPDAKSTSNSFITKLEILDNTIKVLNAQLANKKTELANIQNQIKTETDSKILAKLNAEKFNAKNQVKNILRQKRDLLAPYKKQFRNALTAQVKRNIVSIQLDKKFDASHISKKEQDAVFRQYALQKDSFFCKNKKPGCLAFPSSSRLAPHAM